jgi:hypothetical protein
MMLVVMGALVLRLIQLEPELFMLVVAVALGIQLEDSGALAGVEMAEHLVLVQPPVKQIRVAAVVVYGLRGLQQQAAPVSELFVIPVSVSISLAARFMCPVTLLSMCLHLQAH